ncbi:uncharacterized protein LOC125626074 isoform X2 [Caretta caretta]|uniref:uncharacterized protein LOC125626074 isoform X2 n=1 Tax=Caretta caretta TaxID=8467 RepID=UPI003D58B51F
MEAAVTLSTGGMSVTLIQRGCRDGHPKAGTEPPAGPSRFLHIQADVRYCLSDQCNAKGLDLGSPGQATAPAPSGPTQRYAGLSLGPQPHTLERVTCDGEDARCYHGNGTLTAGKLAVAVFMWSCQAPSCAVPPSRHFGPLQLRQAGTCCSGSYCNGQGALALLSLGLKFSSGHVPTGIPGYGPLANATAWKGHQQPGRSHGTAATELPHQDDSTEAHYPDPDHTGYDHSTDPLNPSYEGDPPHSTGPRARPKAWQEKQLPHVHPRPRLPGAWPTPLPPASGSGDSPPGAVSGAGGQDAWVLSPTLSSYEAVIPPLPHIACLSFPTFKGRAPRGGGSAPCDVPCFSGFLLLISVPIVGPPVLRAPPLPPSLSL